MKGTLSGDKVSFFYTVKKNGDRHCVDEIFY